MIPVAAPAPPRRQVLVGTALASMAALMLMGGMLAIWLLERQKWLARPSNGRWVPEGVEVPGVATNVMLVTALAIPLFAQWAVSASKRGDRAQLGMSLGLVALLAVAIVNAQLYVYGVMDIGVASSGFAGMFYAITGLSVVMAIVGMIFALVAVFRSFGGRESESELLAAHALYWYVFAAAYSALWLIVFVTK